ncbi:hypothetical protein A7982_13346 [Minicystis rosea]|nr:hypothetical protein A7982_13346 [Minicystis rosea]
MANARAARKAKRDALAQATEAIAESPKKATANTVESLIELFSERWNKIGSQADADRLLAEIEHAAKTVAAEELLAYAAAPALRGRLLSLCVFTRANERAAMPHASPSAELLGAAALLSSSGAHRA